MKKIFSAIVAALIISAAGCDSGSGSDPVTPPAPLAVTSFYFSSLDNPNLDVSAAGIISGGTITVNVPAGTDMTNLIPTIDFIGASISLPSGSIYNFTNPMARISQNWSRQLISHHQLVRQLIPRREQRRILAIRFSIRLFTR